jgi:hypothetical protein
MKIIWSIKSIPEFHGLDQASAKEGWIEMYRKVRAEGECRLAPLMAGVVYALVMVLVIGLMRLFPPIPDLARFAVMIVFSGVGGYLGGVLAMSMNYKSGKKHLSSNLPRKSESEQNVTPNA